MNILLATGDTKINNKIIELYDSQRKGLSYEEVYYLEEVEDRIWSSNPDVIILSEFLATKQPFDKKGKLDTYFYQHIQRFMDRDAIFLVDRKANDVLIGKLLDANFFGILPIGNLDNLFNLPQNADQVKQLLGENHPDLYVKQKEPVSAFVAPPSAADIYLPSINTYERIVDHTKPIVSVFWSPLQNVGVGSFITALGNYLAQVGRRVLIIELDWDCPKLARRTALTHQERTLRGALQRLLNGEKGIEGFVVNAPIAEEDLPHTHKAAKLRLKSLPSSLYALSRNADLRYEELDLKDDQIIDRLFWDAKQSGFQHILVDVPSNPNELFTMLSLLAADEKFAVVDDAFTTSGIFKIAMLGFEALGFKPEDFGLIITKIQEGVSASEISAFYDMTPVAALPYDPEMSSFQMDLKLTYGATYMQQVTAFAKRYGIAAAEIEQPKKQKGFVLFGGKKD